MVILQSFKKSDRSDDITEISYGLKLLREDEIDQFADDFYALENSGKNKKFVNKELLQNNEDLAQYFIDQHAGKMIRQIGFCNRVHELKRQLRNLLLI